MRKAQKKQAEEFVSLLGKAHEEIKKAIEKGKIDMAMELLSQCQEGAMKLGELIETTEGEGFVTIPLLEEYCEVLYQLYSGIAADGSSDTEKLNKKLRKVWIEIENSVKRDIRVRLEMVFFPYKASMWDSLESVWLAADQDPDCDAYVVPIPYYDKNADGSFGRYYYEGREFPSYVPVTYYEDYQLEARRPDVIYIHNPYDDINTVTSVDPRYYSDELKKYTEVLVYIPYYASAGGMSEGQALCPAYLNADYIVIQAEKYRKFFDERLPDSKFLALGSPKFDRVIRMCKNPPEPPKEWAEKMKGRKVYFYNTSIGEMLGDTGEFLKKMEYVFRCFRGREDACLLWRPHPLLESTFCSMRPMYKPLYDALRDMFIQENTGIYDSTPDIGRAIAYADAYIGDARTSVTSLFGVAGKPLFIFNKYINTLPQEDDWRGEKINPQLDLRGDDKYQVTRNNQLWFSENDDYHYKFYMDLGTGYSNGGYYMKALEIKNQIYVLPENAQHLLIIKDKKIRRIEFKEQIAQMGAFFGYWYNETYIFLFPYLYPYLVRVNIDTEEIYYVEGINPFNVRYVDGEWRAGGIGLYENDLVFASPVDNQFAFIDIDTFKVKRLTSGSKCNLGTQGIITDGDDLWLLPLNGMTITRWNPKTGDIREYSELPPNFKSVKWPYEYECRERPFGNIAFSREGDKENIVISPSWGNMYVSLDRESGRMEEWNTPVAFKTRGKNGYYVATGMGGFIVTLQQQGKADCRIWYAPERKLYDININTKEHKEVEIEFDYTDLKEHEPGFMEESEWLQYCLNEGVFNSLKDFLDDSITGNQFDRKKQIKAFSKVNADTEGTCGEKVYQFVRKKNQRVSRKKSTIG